MEKLNSDPLRGRNLLEIANRALSSIGLDDFREISVSASLCGEAVVRIPITKFPEVSWGQRLAEIFFLTAAVYPDTPYLEEDVIKSAEAHAHLEKLAEKNGLVIEFSEHIQGSRLDEIRLTIVPAPRID